MSRVRPPVERLLLLDIGNTHCHAGLATPRRLLEQFDVPTRELLEGRPGLRLGSWLNSQHITQAVVCSVVPDATARAIQWLSQSLNSAPLVLTSETLRGVGLHYPRPASIGPDRLANAIAARALIGAPCAVVDFGTAVTFDIVDRRARYVGGIIAPGLAAMTDYLHEKTALLPRIRIRSVSSFVGRSTEEAMLIGAVHGYRGLVRELIGGLRRQLRCPQLPVVATGGYARLLARGLPEINKVRPNLTLEGLRLLWRHHQNADGTRV